MKRSAQATWKGPLATGEGRFTTNSKALSDVRYSFPTRFGNEVGTNPEELIAAAHAGCFTMGLAFYLGDRGLPPASIRTTAELSLEKDGAGWRIAGMHLVTRARVPGVAAEVFQELAEQARSTCLVSRLLNTPVTLSAALE